MEVRRISFSVMDCHEYMNDLMSDFALTVSRGQCVDQGRMWGKTIYYLLYDMSPSTWHVFAFDFYPLFRSVRTSCNTFCARPFAHLCQNRSPLFAL